MAQFLEPGSIEFDLLLIDEASQVQPVDALGAIARSRQIVVVGDDKQLPPTQFFARSMGDGEGEDIEGVYAGAQLEALPYSEASFEVDTTLEPHEVPTKKMAEITARVVWKEGPVHQDEVARRVSSLWGFKRTGSRISQAVNAGLSLAVRAEAVTNSGHFYDAPDRVEPSVRDRSAANSSTLRKPEMLPPSEIRFALEKVVESYIGITPDDAAVEVARLFGFKATSAQLRDVITREIRGLVDLGPLKEKDGKLYITG